MSNPLQRYTGVLFSMLRVVAGFLFSLHGAQKLFGAFGATRATEPLMVFAGVVEFGGGILIAVGLCTSLIAFVASGQMAFAYFMSHAPRGLWPIENRGELAALYCFLFLFIAAHGGGANSLDAWFRRGGGKKS